jgi:hypothetical protein
VESIERFHNEVDGVAITAFGALAAFGAPVTTGRPGDMSEVNVGSYNEVKRSERLSAAQSASRKYTL